MHWIYIVAVAKNNEGEENRDVERTNQATREGPMKRKQKHSKIDRINKKTLS